MQKWINTVALVFLASIGIASTGCVSQRILAFDDHPKYPVTTLQVFVSKSYYVYKEYEHRFYTCSDAGEKLLCKRACGGTTDVRCPTTIDATYGGATNVR
jgi:hypothetical protein